MVSKRATYYKEWREANRERHRANNNAWRRKRGAENHAKIIEYLKDHPCIDCGEADPVVLEFDHRGDKVTEISAAAYMRAWTWERVEAEIAKCEVRCANCHKRKTAREQGWHKCGTVV